uniref:Uncharacterized protein n=1 Tax=Brassica oleracea TaxID=3712 RepID=A0A3P6C5I4_BRAOL|nr:unnamed protein product [Brassica oleracea]
MAVSKKWASTISVVASSLFAFIIVFQIPLFRKRAGTRPCESPLEVISSQLVGSEFVPPPLVKTLLYPGATAMSLLCGSPLPSYHNLFHFYHFDQLSRPSSSLSTDDIRHLEVFAGCCLCLLGALLSIIKPRRLTFIGTLLIYWGLLRDILLFNSSARIPMPQSTMFNRETLMPQSHFLSPLNKREKERNGREEMCLPEERNLEDDDECKQR